MKNKILFYIGLAIMILAGFYTVSFQRKERLLTKVHFKRHYIDTLNQVNNFAIPEHGEFSLQSVSDTIIICDLTNLQISFHAYNGEKLFLYDIKKNNVGTFGSIMNWSYENGRIFISDFTNSYLYSFDPFNRKNQLWKTTQKFSKCIPLNNQQFFAIGIRPYTMKFYFDIISMKDMKSFPIVKLQEAYNFDNPFAADGDIIRDKHGNVFYYAFNMSQFFSLDSNGNVRYMSNTIDNYKTLPANINGINGSQSLSPEHQTVNYFAVADKDYIYVLSNMCADDMPYSQFRTLSLIDRYSNNDGEYDGTLVVRTYNGNAIKEFTVSNNQLFALQGNNVTQYPLRNPKK